VGFPWVSHSRSEFHSRAHLRPIRCIGDRGEFSGNFEQYRRRHQAISRSVVEADRFLVISNVAVFCCQIVAIILALYSAIFYHRESAAMNPHAVVAFVYVYWLGVSVFVLCLAAWLPIIVNHAVSVYRTFIILIGLYVLKVKGKGKVFPYSLPSVGPGADPGVQAVSPQVT